MKDQGALTVPLGNTPQALHLARLSSLALAVATIGNLPAEVPENAGYRATAEVQIAKKCALSITDPIPRTLHNLALDKNILSHNEFAERLKSLCDRTNAPLNESMVIADPKLHAKVSGRMTMLTEALVDYGNELATHWKRIDNFREVAITFLASTPKAFLTKSQLEEIMFTKQKVMDALFVADKALA